MTNLDAMIDMLVCAGIRHTVEPAIRLGSSVASTRIEVDTGHLLLKDRGLSEPVILFDASGALLSIGVYVPVDELGSVPRVVR